MNSRRPTKLSSQQGFTLIELIFVAGGMVVLLIAVMNLTGSVLSTNAEFNETGERSSRASVLQTNIENDSNRAGYSFFTAHEPLAGSFFPKFQPNPDYQVRYSGEVTKNMVSSSAIMTEPILREGSGSMLWVNGTGKFYLKSLLDQSDSNLGILQITYNSWTIYKNSPYRVVASDTTNPKKGRQPGDTFEIVSEVSPNSGVCSINYYRTRAAERSLLFHDPAACPTYPLQPTMNLDNFASVGKFRLSGLFVLNGAEGILAKLPFTTLSAYRMSRPIERLDDGSTLFLSGDKEIDRVYLKKEVQISPLGDVSTLLVNAPQRGDFAAGDYVFLADFSGFSSVLLRVASIQGSDVDLKLDVVPVDDASLAAWQLLYSSRDDYFNVVFPAGSHLFRVAPPVRYGSSTGSEQTNASIYRKSGSDNWDLVATGANDFSIGFFNDCACYKVSATLQSDNAQVSDRPDVPFSLVFKPPFVY